MQVTEELIRKLADLSRLEFSNEEKKNIREDLQKMIGFVEKLNELDLENIEPLTDVVKVSNVYREDEVQGTLDKADALRNAPFHDGNFFRVPKMINKKSE